MRIAGKFALGKSADISQNYFTIFSQSKVYRVPLQIIEIMSTIGGNPMYKISVEIQYECSKKEFCKVGRSLDG